MDKEHSDQSDNTVSMFYHFETRLQALEKILGQIRDDIRAGREQQEKGSIERWDAHYRDHGTHVLAHEREHALTKEAIDKAQQSVKEALLIAREEMTTKFAGVNEWRQTYGDLANKAITRAEAEAMNSQVLRELGQLQKVIADNREQDRKAVEEKSVALSKSTDEKFTGIGNEIKHLREAKIESEGRDRGLMLAWGVIITIVSISISVIGFLR